MFSEGTAPGRGRLGGAGHARAAPSRPAADARQGRARAARPISVAHDPAGGAGAAARLGPARSRHCRDGGRRRRRRRWCPPLPLPGAWAPRCPSCSCSSTCSTRVSRAGVPAGVCSEGNCTAAVQGPPGLGLGRGGWSPSLRPSCRGCAVYAMAAGHNTPHPPASFGPCRLEGGNISGRGVRRVVQRCHLIIQGWGEGCWRKVRKEGTAAAGDLLGLVGVPGRRRSLCVRFALRPAHGRAGAAASLSAASASAVSASAAV